MCSEVMYMLGLQACPGNPVPSAVEEAHPPHEEPPTRGYRVSQARWSGKVQARWHGARDTCET